MLAIFGTLASLVLGGGLFAWLVPGAGIVGKLVTSRDFLKRHPRKVAIALGILAAIVGVLVHNAKASSAIRAAETRGEARAEARYAAKLAELADRARKLADRAEAVARAISQQERAKHDEDLRRIGALERALLVRGPGRAACAVTGGDPALSGSAGGRESPGGAGGAPSTRLSYPDGFLLGVPHRWAVTTGATCDANRAEALRWREADKRQREAWEAMRAGADAPPKKEGK